jgi:putative oxidoreductase
MDTRWTVTFTYFLLRVVLGFLFAQLGSVTLFGWFGGMPPDQPAPEMFSQIWIGKVLELVGGLMILLGLFVRPVAFILSGEMAVAYWQFHAPNGTWPHQNQGMAAVVCCFVFLYMAAQGAGAWSLDSLFGEKRSASLKAP